MRQLAFTTREQSQRLMDAGVSYKTADGYYRPDHKNPISLGTPGFWKVLGYPVSDGSGWKPCWSYQALLDLIPKRYEILINRFELKNGETEYTCKIYHAPGRFHIGDGKTLIEAMVNLMMQIDLKKTSDNETEAE